MYSYLRKNGSASMYGVSHEHFIEHHAGKEAER